MLFGLQELTRVIDHDLRLRQFMARKDQERTEAHEEMEANRRKKSEFPQPFLT